MNCIPIKLGDVTNPNEFIFVKDTPMNHKQKVLKHFSRKVKENIQQLLLTTADNSLEVESLFYVFYNDEWTRGKVVEVFEDHCQIEFYLIDLGKSYTIEFENLYHQVANLPEDKLCTRMCPLAQRFQLFG